MFCSLAKTFFSLLYSLFFSLSLYFPCTVLLSSGCLHLIDSGQKPEERSDTKHSSLFLSVRKTVAFYNSTCWTACYICYQLPAASPKPLTLDTDFSLSLCLSLFLPVTFFSENSTRTFHLSRRIGLVNLYLHSPYNRVLKKSLILSPAS